MDLAGRYHIPASPETVWTAINDPEILRACIPGCQQMAKADPTHFEAAVLLKIGPVKATFKGKVALEELDPPRRCVIVGEGQGGVAGFARGSAEVLLAPEGGGTLLSYTAKASVGGKLAQIGQRLIDGAAKQIADEFFAKFTIAVGGSADAASAAEAAALAAAALPGQEEAVEAAASAPISPTAATGAYRRRDGLAPEIWVVGLIGVIVILLVLFGLVL